MTCPCKRCSWEQCSCSWELSLRIYLAPSFTHYTDALVNRSGSSAASVEDVCVNRSGSSAASVEEVWLADLRFVSSALQRRFRTSIFNGRCLRFGVLLAPLLALLAIIIHVLLACSLMPYWHVAGFQQCPLGTLVPYLHFCSVLLALGCVLLAPPCPIGIHALLAFMPHWHSATVQ